MKNKYFFHNLSCTLRETSPLYKTHKMKWYHWIFFVIGVSMLEYRSIEKSFDKRYLFYCNSFLSYKLTYAQYLYHPLHNVRQTALKLGIKIAKKDKKKITSRKELLNYVRTEK